jgi:hypothetical protein
MYRYRSLIPTKPAGVRITTRSGAAGDQDRLLGGGQIHKAKAALVITLLSHLAERQAALEVGPFSRSAGSTIDQPVTVRTPGSKIRANGHAAQREFPQLLPIGG